MLMFMILGRHYLGRISSAKDNFDILCDNPRYIYAFIASIWKIDREYEVFVFAKSSEGACPFFA